MTALADMIGFGGIGTWELVVIAVVAVLIFGRRLPNVGRSLGESLVQFKKGLKGVEDDVKEVKDEMADVADEVGKAGRDDRPG